MQFSPDLSEDDIISSFVKDLSRNCDFEYSHIDDSYERIKTMVFKVQDAFLQDTTTNLANANFNVNIAGTSNLTSSLGAYCIATKGHYYGLSDVGL